MPAKHFENGRIKSLKLLSASYLRKFIFENAYDFQNFCKLNHSKITRYTVCALKKQPL